jgi:hypothetical protein
MNPAAGYNDPMDYAMSAANNKRTLADTDSFDHKRLKVGIIAIDP